MMPRRDGSGPLGMVRGKGLGPCYNNNYGQNSGLRIRSRNGLSSRLGLSYSKENQKEILQNYKKSLEDRISFIENQIESL